MPKTLYGKIVVSFVLILVALAVAQYFVISRYSSTSLQERDQRLNWDLAVGLAAQLSPLLEMPFDEKRLTAELLRISKLHPSVDPYLIDSMGKVLVGLSYGFEAGVGLETIKIEPIRTALSAGTAHQLPLLGTNPLPNWPETIFSVASVSINGERGYVYVVLHGRRHYMISRGMQEYNAIISGVAAMATLFVFVVIFGGVVFRIITRGFAEVATRVNDIASGDLQARIAPTGDDEMARLGRQIDQMTDTLCANIERAELNDQRRRELVGQISHDLGGPLMSIRSHLLAVLESDRACTDPEIQRRLSTVLRNSSRLSRLVDDLFELTKLEAREVQPDVQPFNCLDLVTEEVVPKLSPLAEQSNLLLKAEYSERLSYALGDVDLIERVVSNLVENAIRYHDKPGGWVTISLEERDDKIFFSVSDNGPGIPEAERDKIFESFYRTESAKDKTNDGTGLGLAIVKQLLEVHGQKISVSSRVGEGTTFSFELFSILSDQP